MKYWYYTYGGGRNAGWKVLKSDSQFFPLFEAYEKAKSSSANDKVSADYLEIQTICEISKEDYKNFGGD